MCPKYLKLFTLTILGFCLVHCSKDEPYENASNSNNGGTTGPTVGGPDTGVTPYGDLDPKKVPGKNFDLSQWNLSIPVAEGGWYSD